MVQNRHIEGGEQNRIVSKQKWVESSTESHPEKQIKYDTKKGVRVTILGGTKHQIRDD